MFESCLSDSQPYGLAVVFGFDYLLFQTADTGAAVNQLTYKFILACEDAALSILDSVACMDADALPLAVELSRIYSLPIV